MKNLSGALVIIILATRLLAQSNTPVRLALIAETEEASAASDVLTAQLSGNPKLHLLERNEIEKVYREQALSAGDKDYLKLGRILGADGLLLFDVVRTPQATNLTARLIAVKPGVVLMNESFPWPLKDMTGWTPIFASHLNPFLPKLSVLAKDAIPISIVNLRSSVQSAEAQETERQLKLLIIQRLSQEPRFFVLERQRMQLLGGEKELKADESAFWNGSYLLEGVADQSGYSRETITINARLTPPKGGAPLQFDISGNRTNLAEVINRLVVKVVELLKAGSGSKEWNAADEAQQYFAEAQWALSWGLLAEAQAAVDAAWALGKNDRPCAVLRITTCIRKVPAVVAANVNILSTGWRGFRFVHINDAPDPKDCDAALEALRHYEEFSRTMLAGRKAANLQSNEFLPDWYQLGINVLNSASGVLWHFSNFPGSQEPVREKLAELRAMSRSVAKLITNMPMSHGGKYEGKSFPSARQFFNIADFMDDLAIFECTVKWGCFWQDRPEDGIALYRELMTAPPFCCGMGGLWTGELDFPRLAAWNPEDEKRIPTVWRSFIDELSASTNVFFRMEAKALACADARTDAWLEKQRNLYSRERYPPSEADHKWKASRKELWDFISTNYEAIVACNENLPLHNWGMNSLFDSSGEYDASEDQDRFRRIQLNYLETINSRRKHEADKLSFARQLKFLKENKPYEYFEFVNLFQSRNYSTDQALEILPLLAAYKSNLVAKSQSGSGMEKAESRSAVAQVGFLENDVNRLLHPPAPQPQLQPKGQAPRPSAVANAVAAAPPEPIAATNIAVIKKFHAIPLDGLPGNEIEFPKITAHQWFEGKLLLDFEYTTFIYKFDEKGKWNSTRGAGFPAIAIFDLATEQWNVVSCPEVGYEDKNNFYHRSVLLRGELFSCESKQIKKYDFQKRQWQVLDISDGNNYELFAIHGHLYAANSDAIFEITDNGKATRLLTSTRRHPPISVLDTQPLGVPILFSGSNHSLRAIIGNKIFTWMDSDWHEDYASPSLGALELFDDGVVFRSVPDAFLGERDKPSCLSWLTASAAQPDLCFISEPPAENNFTPPGFSRTANIKTPTAKPFWTLPSDLALANVTVGLHESDLYLLVDHSHVEKISNDQHVLVQENILPQDGYHAALLCFSSNLPSPQKLFLKFDSTAGCPPVTGIRPSSWQMRPAVPPAWMLFTTNLLVLGLESPRNPVTPNGPADKHAGHDYKTGVWMIPLGQVESVVTTQKQIQLEQKRKTMPQRKAAELHEPNP